MLVLIAGSIAIAALVGWALTRSVEPAAPASASAAAPVGEMPQSATATPTAQTTPAATATSSTATPSPEPNTGVPRVNAQQLKDLVDRGAVTVVDVRDSVSYTQGHIPGAVHIPFARVESEARYLPKDKPVITYCT